MRLLKAKIENFRSVEDSGEFTIDEAITCLVGKNESGKTSLLTALYRLNPIIGEGKFDQLRDYPRRHSADYDERHDGDDANVITTWWTIDEEERKTIAEALGADTLTSPEVIITRGYDNTTYWTVHVDEARLVLHLLDTSGLHEEERAAIGTPKSVADLKSATQALSDEAAPRKTQFMQRIDQTVPNGKPRQAALKLLSLPKFLFFSQYQRMQGQVSLEQTQQKKASNSLTDDDQVFIALCEMAGVTLETAASIKDFETIVARFEGASNKISGEIFTYWTQNKHLKVQFRFDPAQAGDPPPFNSGRVFRTRIENTLHQVTVPFDDRSAGFVWFFSFLALFSQVKKRHTGKIILLLDEPGLSLHAKAQADLLRYFREKLAPHHQVLFTTHSPFMVPPDNLLAARTVEDVVIYREGELPDVRGTKVGSDVLSTDRDTLFPLQGALGYEITQTLFVGEHTLLVEGPSDLLYLKAFSEELRARKRTHLDQRWTICPSGGIDKVSAFMSLFGGNRLHVAVLTDFASGQKKKVDDLRRSKVLKDGHVLTANSYAGQDEAAIEDILGSSLYAELVNACYGLKGKQSLAPAGSGVRSVKHAEDWFKTLPNTVPEFDHYAPAAYFTEHRNAMLKKVSEDELEAVFKRAETLFDDINGLL